MQQSFAIENSFEKKPVSKNLLLYSYSLIPFFFIWFGIDAIFFDQQLKNSPMNNGFVLMLAIFIPGLPHTIASIVTLFDRTYLQFYKTPIIKNIFFAFIIAAIVANVPVASFAIFAIITMNHVMAQQYGILRAVFGYKENGDDIIYLKNYSVVASIFMFCLIYSHEMRISPAFFTLIGWLLKASIALVLFYGYKSIKKALEQNLDKAAFLYLISNILAVLFAYLFYICGYYIFTILISRLIHDFSAIIIYLNHETNRNAVQNHNYFYRLLNFLPISRALMLIIVVGIISYLLSKDPAFRNLITFLTFFHYLIEGVIWKSGTPHRQSLGC